MEGIAYYTQATTDVIFDIVSGRNPAPSFVLLHRILKLHRTVRPNLYNEIMKKIIKKKEKEMENHSISFSEESKKKNHSDLDESFS